MPTPDVSVSLGLDYAAFTQAANAASSKAIEQAIKNFSLHAKQASVIAGTGAARATAFSGFFGSLVAPITRPFYEVHDTIRATVAVARSAASRIAESWQREFGKGSPVAAAWAAVGFQIAAVTRFTRGQFRHAAADMRAAFIGAAVSGANNFPALFAKVMRSVPALNRWLHGQLVNFGTGPGLFTPLRNSLHSLIGAIALPMERRFPELFNRILRTFPRLETFLRGRVLSGVGPTLFTPVRNALRSILTTVTLPLERHFPDLFNRMMRSMPRVETFLRGRILSGSGPRLLDYFTGPVKQMSQRFAPLLAPLAPLKPIFSAVANSAMAAFLIIKKSAAAALTIVVALGKAIAVTLGAAFNVLRAIGASVLAILRTALLGIWNVLTAVARSALLLGSGLAVIFTIAIVKATKYGKELDALARQSGYTAAEIETVRLALFRSNQTAASTTGIMEKLRESLMFGEGPQLLQYLGLNLEKLRRLAPVAQFAEIAATVNRIANPLQRARVATALLGQEGANAIAQFQKGDANLAPALRKYVADLAKGISGMQMAADHWSRIKLSVEVFFNTIAAKIAPVLERISAWAERILLPVAQEWAAAFGEKLANGLQTAIGLVALIQSKAVTISQLLWLAFQVSIRAGADLLFQIIRFAGALLWNTLKAAWGFFTQPAAIDAVSAIFRYAAHELLAGLKVAWNFLGNPAAWIGMASLWFGISARVWAFWFDSLNKFLNLLRHGMVFAALYLKNHFLAIATAFISNLLRGMLTVAKAAANITTLSARFVAQLIAEVAATIGSGESAENESFADFIKSQRDIKYFNTDALKDLSETRIRSGLASLNAAAQSATAAGNADRWKASADLAAAVDALRSINFDAWKDLAMKIPELWRQSAVTLFSDPKLVAQFQSILRQALERGREMVGKTRAQAAPGQTGAPLGLGVVQTRFDEWRRVGGGLGNAARTTMQTVAEKQLSVQERMLTVMQAHLSLVRGAAGRLSPGAGVAALITTGAGGY